MTLAMSSRADLQFQIGRLILTFGDLRLIAGVGHHQLAFPFSHSASWLGQDSIANVAVILGARVYSTTTSMRWVGDVASRVFTVRSFGVPDELVVGLTDAQLLALDAERHDGPLRLQIDLTGTLVHVPAGVHPSMDASLTLITQPEAWLKNLDQIGSDLGILIRVPSPLTEPGAIPTPPTGAGQVAVASRSQATARLRQARTEVGNGQYENSVATCRLVLDSLGLLAPLPSAKSVFDKKAQDRSQDERWAAIQHNVHSLSSGAHHDDTLTRGFTWSRPDAEAVLAITSCLVMRAFRTF
jgi:hypothetical protein